MPGKKPDRAVLVGVDESEASLAAVRWAAAEALHRGCRLQLFQAGTADRRARERFARAHRWLSRAAQVAEEAAPGVATLPVVRAGLAVELLVERSRSVSLVVLGSHGLGGLRGAAIGSVALRVAAGAHCPVVVVRGRAAAGGAVVVGVAGDERAGEFAFAAAANRRVPLIAVRAWRSDRPERAEEEDRALRECIAAWADKYPEVPVRVRAVRERSAGRALMAVEGAQLVVIGTRGQEPVSGELLGSTGNRLLAHAACPVAVVRGAFR
ncbi:universal stress protein [Amycolatopsis dendrobii]|uniref:Universal stress protein n=1 Tax=Amycolatopsis dendrobii TaxID=2760662 RepID=A0A7W3VXD3_9PSEU|nr:universal stress protein [Amycolatopsis dendrobii]MBB1154492.1 universal stress protein [Amycolatopsis dendrobii]